jgi:hypothetical protein
LTHSFPRGIAQANSAGLVNPGKLGYGLPNTMDVSSLSQSPFSALTFIAAPALLTNTSSVLALSTINRMLRTRDRMHELLADSAKGNRTGDESAGFIAKVDRVERQAVLLLKSLRAVYVALASFASATLVTLLGAALASFDGAVWFHILAGLGLFVGFVGVGGLVVGSATLLHATQLSLLNIQEEAAFMRKKEASGK